VEERQGVQVITSNLDTVHWIRGIFIVVSFLFAFVVATTLSVSHGSPLIGRILLVLFSFSIMTGQVARFNESLKWNTYVTGLTLALCVLYSWKMIKEFRSR
jgi:Ca2+/Na+ antiporter